MFWPSCVERRYESTFGLFGCLSVSPARASRHFSHDGATCVENELVNNSGDSSQYDCRAQVAFFDASPNSLLVVFLFGIIWDLLLTGFSHLLSLLGALGHWTRGPSDQSLEWLFGTLRPESLICQSQSILRTRSRC